VGGGLRPGRYSQCPYCGGQLLSCCFGNDLDFVPLDDRMPWTGFFMGEAECEEFGWYAVMGPRGWESCAPGTPHSTPGINRLIKDARWDRERKRFVKK
jgi:hypothetical protein